LEKVINDPFGKQQCWWINHGVNLWRDQPIFKAARSVIDGMNATVPDVMVNVALHRADDTGFVTMFHYFDPGTQGIVSSNGSWRDSEWTKDRVNQDPRRAAYIQQLRQWGRGWVPVVFAYR
jgi:hypothetical protein